MRKKRKAWWVVGGVVALLLIAAGVVAIRPSAADARMKATLDAVSQKYGFVTDVFWVVSVEGNDHTIIRRYAVGLTEKEQLKSSRSFEVLVRAAVTSLIPRSRTAYARIRSHSVSRTNPWTRSVLNGKTTSALRLRRNGIESRYSSPAARPSMTDSTIGGLVTEERGSGSPSPLGEVRRGSKQSKETTAVSRQQDSALAYNHG